MTSSDISDEWLSVASEDYGIVYIKNTCVSNSQSIIIDATTTPDRTDLKYVAYGTTFVGDPVTRYDALVASANVRITVSPLANASITHTITYSSTK